MSYIEFYMLATNGLLNILWIMEISMDAYVDENDGDLF